jgi:FAD synthase
MNTYSVDEKKLVYTPVNPEESSSGTYSGGKAKRKDLSKQDFKKINALLKEALVAESEQQETREMGSALLASYHKGKLNRKVILKPNSVYKEKIEAFFKTLLR